MPCFQVIDETSQRIDLARRTELKFPMVGKDVGLLRNVLEASCYALQHRQPKPGDAPGLANPKISTVRSLYFDDPRLTSAYANIQGLAQRQKLRLRWYDSPLPQHQAYLEIKWRSNTITGKHRLKVECDEPMATLPYPVLVRGLRDALPLPFGPILDRLFDPTLIVEYQREHYASSDASVRLTIDYRLRFYDQTGKRHPNLRFGVTKPHLVVLEGKSAPDDSGELRTILAPLSLRAGRCSKYVHGLQTVGLLQASRC